MSSWEMPPDVYLENDGFQPCEHCGCYPEIIYTPMYSFETYRMKARCPRCHSGVSVGGLIMARDEKESIRQRLLKRWAKLQRGIRRGKNKRARNIGTDER